MILTRAFVSSSYLLSLAGFFALVVAQVMPLWVVALTLAAYGASIAAAARGRPVPVPRAAWTAITVGFFAFYIVDAVYVADSLMTASLHLVVYLLIHKLLTLQTAKDYLYLYAISFIQFLAASGLTTDFAYAAAFLAYLLAATWTMVLYHLWCEMRVGSHHEPMITGAFFLTTNTVVVGAFVLTAVFFFLIPRVGAGFFQRRTAEGIRVTGFSEKVDLGAIGAIKSDPTVVMRVTLPDYPKGLEAPPYWRGMAFDAFNGRAWQNTLPGRAPVPRGPDGRFVVEPPGPARSDAAAGPDAPDGRYAAARPDAPLIRQEFLLEPIETEVLFAADRPVAVEGRFSLLRRDAMGGLFLPAAPAARVGYTAVSRRVPVAPEDRRRADVTLPPSLGALSLQLPDLDPRITALAREAVDGAETALDRVAAVQQFLQRNYRYSLDIQSSRVEDFLLKTKTGYCEQYATAAILMLRSVGIPARLVTGFLGGEWNAFGGYYTVRQRDAHTWVEVYLPASGWVAIDPTPAGPAAPATTVSSLVQALDAMRLRWDRYIIRYSALDQMTAAIRMRDEAEGARAAVLRWLRRIPRPALPALPSDLTRPLLLVAGAAVLAGLVFRLLRRPVMARFRARFGRDGAPAFYRRMLRLLRRRRLTRLPAQTPREFMEAALATHPHLVPVRDLTALYEQVRFGGTPLTPAAARHAEALLARLHHAPGAAGPRPRLRRAARPLVFLAALGLLSAPPAFGQSREAALKTLEQREIAFHADEFVTRVRNGEAEVVEVFLAAGMPPDAMGNFGRTPLMFAAQLGHLTIVQMLVAKGANVNARAGDGRTVLMFAAGGGHTAVVEALLTKGADPRAKSVLGESALGEAAANDHTAVVEMLKKAGARP